MKLAWERHDVVRLTARTSELAALVAAARLAHVALAAAPGEQPGERPGGQSTEQAGELGRVLAEFDRAGKALQRRSPSASPGSPAAEPQHSEV